MEKAELSFPSQVLLVNVRRIEPACLLGIFTKSAEILGGFTSTLRLVEIPLAIFFLLMTQAIRRGASRRRSIAFVAAFLTLTLLMTQFNVAALGAQGRLTSAYPLMLLSLALLFVVPPRVMLAGTSMLFASYCAIVWRIEAGVAEKFVAIENTGLTSIIAVVAATLIHSNRQRDHEQQRQIRRQNDALRDRNAELDALMAITAHDLRSPLHGIRNLFDLAMRRAGHDTALPLRVLEQTIASVDGMLALVTRLLDAHAAEQRPLTAIAEEDVRGVVLGAEARVAPLARSAGVAVEIDLPPRPLVAICDVAALGQMLDNLLSNAVRYSPAAAVVTITARRDHERIVLSVRDRGPGVAGSQLRRLFMKFQRGAAPAGDAAPGTGMGLFIVATLAARMDATIRHEPAPGGGASFVISLRAA
ncbi:hypothetical protein ASE95_01235 [Sphingomonas sp. Leaf231]|nr:hypothetical protein ASE95_01235 [Sphingomonas sp. Leaf231]